MQRSANSYAHLLLAIPTQQDIGNLVAQVSQRMYEVSTLYDNNQFLYNWYANSLDSLFMDFTGPPFSGEDSLRTQYELATNARLAQFGGIDISFLGGTPINLPNDLYDFMCVPGTGNPPTGDGTVPCVPIPSPSNLQDLNCNNSVELAATLNAVVIDTIGTHYDQANQTVNDGYAVDTVSLFDIPIALIPSRTLP